MAELKPCPFCGGEAKFVETCTYATGEKYGYVRCAKTILDCCVCQNEMLYEKAIEAWNRRAEE